MSSGINPEFFPEESMTPSERLKQEAEEKLKKLGVNKKLNIDGKTDASEVDTDDFHPPSSTVSGVA